MKDSVYHVAALPFEAARHVSILPKEHRSRRLHGHSFMARIRAEWPLGWGSFPGAETEELRFALKQCLEVLDYDLLNNHIEIPTDENLARWVRENLSVPGVDVAGIQSSANQGVDLDKHNQAHIWHRFRFEAAHELPNVPKGHQCGRMHGHGFEVILHAKQALNESDMGVDFDLLADFWSPLYRELHYACLNDLPGLENPTSEMLAAWLWKRLKPQLPELSWITVYETVTAGCHYDGTHYRIWKEFRFESALRLIHAPEDDYRRRLHGHSYLSRLHLTAELDDVMGWTVDYGDVKEKFKPAYKKLDHHRLDKIDGVESADTAAMLTWMKDEISVEIPQLDRIDLYETPGCGAMLSWGSHGPALPV